MTCLRKRGKRLLVALMLPVSAVLVILGVAVSLTVYKVGYDALYRERVATVLSVVEVADEVVRHYGRLEERGELSREEAQLFASEAVSSMRYNGQDYVFGYDMGQRVTIPFQTHERGKRLDSQDPKGVWVHRELLAVASSPKGEGMVTYHWLNSNSGAVEEKVAYVKSYGPWGWWYGTGLYTADLRSSVMALAFKVVVGVILGLMVTVSVVFLIVRRMTSRMGVMVGTIGKMAQGDLTVSFEDKVGDEISSVSASLGAMAEMLRGTIEVVSSEASLSSQRSEAMRVTDETVRAMERTAQEVARARDGLIKTAELTVKLDEGMKDIASQSEVQATSSDEMARAVDSLTNSAVRSVELMAAIRSATEETERGAEDVALKAQEMAEGARAMLATLEVFVLKNGSLTPVKR